MWSCRYTKGTYLYSVQYRYYTLCIVNAVYYSLDYTAMLNAWHREQRSQMAHPDWSQFNILLSHVYIVIFSLFFSITSLLMYVCSDCTFMRPQLSYISISARGGHRPILYINLFAEIIIFLQFLYEYFQRFQYTPA